MRKTRRRLIPLILGITTLLLLLGFLLFIPPTTSWSLLFITVSAGLPFFLLLGLTAYFIPSFIFKSRRHGLLISFFLVLYLLFRLWGLTHPFFAFLLLALFLTFELLFTRKRI